MSKSKKKKRRKERAKKRKIIYIRIDPELKNEIKHLSKEYNLPIESITKF